MREEKIGVLINILRKFRLEEVLEIEKSFDEQYRALEHLYRGSRDPVDFCILVLLNALVCYQLSGTGEQYWWEFARYFYKRKIDDPINQLKDFLRKSRYNKRLLEAKLRRLTKLRGLLPMLYEEIKKEKEDPEKLRALLAKKLNAKPTSKTIVFAIKMLNYACRIVDKENRPLPMNISIPVDSRIREISSRLGVYDNIEEFWGNIAKIVDIPPLHIDSLLWVTWGLLKRRESIENRKLNMLLGFLKDLQWE
ncbi:MAG: N-glycosylase/DNA lyase [Candidatus Njordarchaeia archaeon]